MIRSTTKCVMIYDVWSTIIKVYNYVYSSKQVYIRYTIQQKNLAIDIKYCQIEDTLITEDVQDFSPEIANLP